MWIKHGVGNIHYGVDPMQATPIIESFESHSRHTGYRADNGFFARYKRLHYAIWLDYWECDHDHIQQCDAPAPPLYVLVINLGGGRRMIDPLYRGSPFWREQYSGNYRYAACKSNQELIDICLRAREMGGMDDVARIQFNKHVSFVSQQRTARGLQ